VVIRAAPSVTVVSTTALEVWSTRGTYVVRPELAAQFECALSGSTIGAGEVRRVQMATSNSGANLTRALR
jgi:hypothetical protein